jgi:hypothetical protein
MLKKIFISVVLLIGILGISAHAQIPMPKGPIEQKYRKTGPWSAVSTVTTQAICNREDKLCDIWFPTNLGSNPITGAVSGFKHPVIAWANGTGSPSSKYAYYLRHLASWGFIVIASRDLGTGEGGTTADAAKYILDRGNTPGNIFFGKVDATNVGVSGHSQGGATVLKLASSNTAPFKAFVPIHAPGSLFAWLCCDLTYGKMASTHASKSILFIGGFGDKENAKENQNFYTATPTTTTKAVGILNTSKHDDIQGSPDCGSIASCSVGIYSYLGYPTAWFMWKLQGATDVQGAFKAPGGEFVRSHPAWNFNQMNLPQSTISRTPRQLDRQDHSQASNLRG